MMKTADLYLVGMSPNEEVGKGKFRNHRGDWVSGYFSRFNLMGQMADHFTDLFEVEGLINETIDSRIDGLLQEGIPSLRND